MPIPRLPLRIAVVQFSPKIGQVQANLAKARELCRGIVPQSVDLVCFPEMAFTGYVFENTSTILPHLEKPKVGPTSHFCSELAQRLQCHVVAGYPERLADKDDEETGEIILDRKYGANSAVIYGPTGDWIGGYRKTHLYETDITWAQPGTGFITFTMPSPLRTMTLGICMDLNPRPPTLWTSTEGPYELAEYSLSKKTNVLILLNAWLDSGKEPEEEHDWSTLNYWAVRLEPLWTSKNNTNELPKSDTEPSNSDDSGDETVVVVCNRTGEENGKTFAGTSAIFSMRQGSGRPKLLDMMTRHEEGVRLWDLTV